MKLSTCCGAAEHKLNGFCSSCKEHAEFEVLDDISGESFEDMFGPDWKNVIRDFEENK